jgi:tight adherence protein C
MVFISITMLLVGIVTSRREASTVRARLDALTTLDEGLSLEEVELSRPFRERVLIPVFGKFGSLLAKYSPKGLRDRYAARLAQSGNLRMDPMVFLGVKALAAIALLGFAVLICFLAHMPIKQFTIYFLMFPTMGYVLPDLWLGMQTGHRKAAISAALPDLLDLLTVSVEAGLGFDQAMAKSAEKMGGPLTQEIKRTQHEMRMGKSRADALRSFSDRVGIPDLTSFCAALIQADQLGVSIASVLRVQSDSMRTKRRQRAEEAAMKAPLKMLFPLIIFIFPTLFIILLGPAIINIMENFKVN